MKIFSLILVFAVVMIPGHPALAAKGKAQKALGGEKLNEASSKTVPMLAKALKAYPDADANHDGVLTGAEALDYRQKVLGGAGGAKGGKKKKGAAGTAMSQDIPKPTFENVSYGPHERNVLDFWQAKSSGPAPVLVCIHGGAFVAGDKSSFRTNPTVAQCLARGISVAALNYRYVTIAPFPAPMHDAGRAIQFIRSKGAEWNVDPKRVGAMGGSAGANISLWLACHDDLADPKSEDPVARQSTRLSFMIGNGTQTFNDPELIHKYVYAGNTPHTSFLPFYGMKDISERDSERVKRLAHEASAYYFVTKDDPPVMLNYKGNPEGAPLPEGTPQGVYIHHPSFGVAFKKQYEALGLECILHYDGSPVGADETMKFIEKNFGMEEATAKK